MTLIEVVAITSAVQERRSMSSLLKISDKGRFLTFMRYYKLLVGLFTLAYLVIAFLYGGDAFHGYMVNGAYFMAHDSHSPAHQVSKTVYFASRWCLGVTAILWAGGFLMSLASEAGLLPNPGSETPS